MEFQKPSGIGRKVCPDCKIFTQYMTKMDTYLQSQYTPLQGYTNIFSDVIKYRSNNFVMLQKQDRFYSIYSYGLNLAESKNDILVLPGGILYCIFTDCTGQKLIFIPPEVEKALAVITQILIVTKDVYQFVRSTTSVFKAQDNWWENYKSKAVSHIIFNPL